MEYLSDAMHKKSFLVVMINNCMSECKGRHQNDPPARFLPKRGGRLWFGRKSSPIKHEIVHTILASLGANNAFDNKTIWYGSLIQSFMILSQVRNNLPETTIPCCLI
jgi:hypothetical protein